MSESDTPPGPTHKADDEHRQFVLTYVQPGLVGLMDGSVSTLAPIFAAAFATRDSWTTFLVGLAASVGAGISMAFAEALSDDGKISGRGSPWARGWICGGMTALGGLGHTIPFLIQSFTTAMVVATIVVVIELFTIAWIRKRWMGTSFWTASLQVVVGGAIVFAIGILIGSL
jgi:VIT1/CCC1 family predicted Fe2+/Mn2+ transporter